jgi:hypothetical protein
MSNLKSILSLGEQKIAAEVLRDILPEDCRKAHHRGSIFIHGLGRFLDAEVVLLDHCAAEGPEFLRPWRWYRHLSRATKVGASLCAPHFDEDVGAALAVQPSQIKGLLQEWLLLLEEHVPEIHCTFNVGASFSPEAREVTSALLDLLDEGATKTNVFLVMRVRSGLNMRKSDPHYDLLERTLDMARHRQGTAFSLMDSTLNYQWLDGVTYTAEGLRVEPLTGDFLRGTRGHYITGRVSVDLLSVSNENREEIDTSLKLAARVLAQRLEFLSTNFGSVFGPQIIDLKGLNDLFSRDVLGTFGLLDRISTVVSALSAEYGMQFALAATCDSDQQESLLFEAERQHILRGGHCLTVPAGPHLSVEELYAELLNANNAGVSFMRFGVTDVRCNTCHLAVAALGPCPRCGCVQRREVVNEEGRLFGGVKAEPDSE